MRPKLSDIVALVRDLPPTTIRWITISDDRSEFWLSDRAKTTKSVSFTVGRDPRKSIKGALDLLEDLSHIERRDTPKKRKTYAEQD